MAATEASAETVCRARKTCVCSSSGASEAHADCVRIETYRRQTGETPRGHHSYLDMKAKDMEKDAKKEKKK